MTTLSKDALNELGHEMVKIKPKYRKNLSKLRKKYAMDKTVLAKLEDLFSDGPGAEEFLQTTKA